MGYIERYIYLPTLKERMEFIREILGGKDVLYLSSDGSTFYAAVDCGLENKAYVVHTYQKTNPHYAGDYRFGYKVECETAGPHRWKAPRRLLDLLTPTSNELAIEWRKKCERTLLNRARLKSLPIGTRIQIKDSACDDLFCIKKGNGRLWVNEHRTLFVPFAQLIQHDLLILGVDPRFVQKIH